MRMEYFSHYDKEDEIEETAVDAPSFQPSLQHSSAFASLQGASASVTTVSLPTVNAAPPVQTFLSLLTPLPDYQHPSQSVIYTNPKVGYLTTPLQGPLTPLQEAQGGFSRSLQNHLTGHLEPLHVNQVSFNQQYHAYQATGMAANPSDTPVDLLSSANASQHRFVVATGIQGGQDTPKDHQLEALLSMDSIDASFGQPIVSRAEKRKRMKRIHGDPASETFLGPWAPPVAEALPGTSAMPGKGEDEAAADAHKGEKTQEKDTSPNNIDENALDASRLDKGNGEKVTTIFHGKAEQDYQGRSWMALPVHFKEPTDTNATNYLPKKSIHTYVGHTMGVQAIRFFPKSGHLLLSAGLDGQVKIWDVYNQRKCLRTYLGHTLAVRDIQFTNDGRKFYSCSYDKNIQLWDTEYGKILGTYTNGSIPYCVTVNPQEDQQHVFIIGSANKRAVQFDSNSGQIVQEYNEHLAAVNSVTFCDNDRKIVTTSDDKKIFIWDYGIPVVVKHIAEPSMRSMPSVCVHPSNKYLAAQSMDNQIVVYEATGRFRYQARKQFKGHVCAGYAIHPGFSRDGRYIMSGDASGKLWFWDWKNMKNYRTLQCHNNVCIDCAWHPTMTSRVATCGWDGLIKLWD